MATMSLTRRVEALEAEVARLNANAEIGRDSTKPWWDQMWGAFAGDAAFQEAVELGRQYRQSRRPKRSSRGKR